MSIVGKQVQIAIGDPLSHFGLSPVKTEVIQGEITDLLHEGFLVRIENKVRYVPIEYADEILILGDA